MCKTRLGNRSGVSLSLQMMYIGEASIERIMLPHSREAGRHPLHSFPVKHFATNNGSEESHAYVRGRLCGEAMQDESFTPTKINSASAQSPNKATMCFEEVQLVRWGCCYMRAIMHQAYASSSLSTRRPMTSRHCIAYSDHVVALGIRITNKLAF
jgi:hypothetical protein